MYTSDNVPKETFWEKHQAKIISIGSFILIAGLILWLIDSETGHYDANSEAIEMLHQKQDSLFEMTIASKIRDQVYEKQIQDLSKQIQKSKDSVTIIRNYYVKNIPAVAHYSDKQLDSFLTRRYGND